MISRRVMTAAACVLGFGAGSFGGELDLLPIGDPARSTVLSSVEEGGFFGCRDGRELKLDELAAQLIAANVVLIGEAHTDMDQKLFHAELLDKMSGIKDELVLGMEFFLRSDQAILDRWSRGEIDDDELLDEVGWYDRGGYRFEYYRPVMHIARERGIRVVGLNVDRDIPRAVNRGGLEGLDEAQRREVGMVDTGGSPQHRYLISRYFGETVAMLPPQWFENMYAAQCLWDVVMARSILDDLPKGSTMVVIVGSGHVAYDLGIARRVRDEAAASGRNGVNVVTFCPLTAPAPDPDGDPHGHPMGGPPGGMGSSSKPARFVRSLADFVGAFPDRGGVEAYPSIGLQLDEGDAAAAVVTMVWPETLAATAGFEHGDRIVDVNGQTPANLSDLRDLLAGIEWGQRLGLTVERGDERLEVAMLLFPEVEATEQAIAAGWEVRPIVAVNPVDTAPVTGLPEPPSEAQWRLVSGEDGRMWIEVRAGEALDEVHELDADGRVERSLYRTPRADGAVEILYRRDREGELEGTVRRDRAGAPI